jgi:hypothetical protein
MNDVGEPYAGEPHVRFDRGPLARRNKPRGLLVPGRCAEKCHHHGPVGTSTAGTISQTSGLPHTLPPPVTSHATGGASFELSADGAKLHFRLSAQGLGRITMAHIHLGATPVNGPVVAFLFPMTMNGVNGEGFEVVGTLTPTDVVGPPRSTRTRPVTAWSRKRT